jgi:hypothetical protein
MARPWNTLVQRLTAVFNNVNVGDDHRVQVRD